jgi:hypothetical protein
MLGGSGTSSSSPRPTRSSSWKTAWATGGAGAFRSNMSRSRARAALPMHSSSPSGSCRDALPRWLWATTSFTARGCRSGSGRQWRATLGAIFAYELLDPSSFGVVTFDGAGRPTGLEEKPKKSESNFAVPGLYFYGKTFERDKTLLPRGHRLKSYVMIGGRAEFYTSTEPPPNKSNPRGIRSKTAPRVFKSKRVPAHVGGSFYPNRAGATDDKRTAVLQLPKLPGSRISNIISGPRVQVSLPRIASIAPCTSGRVTASNASDERYSA